MHQPICGSGQIAADRSSASFVGACITSQSFLFRFGLEDGFHRMGASKIVLRVLWDLAGSGSARSGKLTY